MSIVSNRLWPAKTLRRVALALLAVALLVMPAAAANAHRITVQHPSDPSYAVMGEGHQQISACDIESDGDRAYVRYYVSGVLQPAVYDPDGAGGRCGGLGIGTLTLDSFNICVQNEGCGNPYYWWLGY